ncbi:MAG: 5-formyltetrahydrofolate cyclo-ligase [Saccharofermentanales bacterium]
MNKKTKMQIRTEIREIRENQAQSDCIAKSSAICSKILSLEIFSENNIKNKKVGMYFPIKGEADLSAIKDYLLRNGACCFYPITYKDEIFMEKYDPEMSEKDQIITGKFGVLEPVRKSENAKSLDIILIPGVAYDLSGNRIGFGKGYYDNYLSANYTGKTVLKIAPAFEFQIVDDIFNESHDMPVDIIATEKRIIYTHDGQNGGKSD